MYSRSGEVVLCPLDKERNGSTCQQLNFCSIQSIQFIQSSSSRKNIFDELLTARLYNIFMFTVHMEKEFSEDLMKEK
ncbi:hypothetical protein ACH3XW_44975 [Acanthocheilonema viteae]